MENILKVKNVEKYYGSKSSLTKAINDISFEVEKGEFVAIMGASGSGKTTLLNLISTIDKVTAGEIFVDGENITKFSVEKKSRLGIARTFQNGSIFSDLSVADNVKIGFHSFINYKLKDVIFRSKRFFDEEKKISDEVYNILKIFGLDCYENLLAGDLSYALQGKLDIARAVACGPKLLLLDRPSNGMDKSEAEDFMDVIKMVNKKFNTAVVLIENDIDLIMNICDRVVVMEYGTIIASDKPVEIKNNQALASISFS